MAEEKTFFDSWFKTQQDFIGSWMDLTKNFQQAVMGVGGSSEGKSDTVHDMFNLYNSWIRTVGNFFDDMMKTFPIGVGRDTFSKLFSGADSYMKLYDFWKPLHEAWAEKGFTMDSYKDIFDPSSYKEVIDKVFGFGQPETLTEFYGQASKLIETWGSSVQNFAKPWTEAIQKNITAFPELISGKQETNLNLFHNMFDAFQNTYGKALKMPKVGKDREKIELMMTCLDKCSDYMAKNTEFQYKMYVTGQSAMEKVMNAIGEKVKSGDEIKHYDEFFKIWTDINEDEYFELFKTEAFSKLQGELLDSALDARRHIHQLMEVYLEDFPIALRSEMNDVYKTIYDLKKKVRNVEKKLKTTSLKEVAK